MIRAGAPDWQRLAFDEFHALVHGLLYKSLGPSAEVEDLVSDVFLSFFESAQSIREPHALRSYVVSVTMNAARRELRQRRLLLVLDNVEHLRCGVGVLEQLLAQAPHVKLLLTSRVQLGLDIGTTLELGPMDLPRGPDDLERADRCRRHRWRQHGRAVRLLRARQGARHPASSGAGCRAWRRPRRPRRTVTPEGEGVRGKGEGRV